MATPIEKLREKIKSFGIENTDELPAKTKRKLAEFEKLANNRSPIHFKNNQRTESTVNKLIDLAEDILEETELYAMDEKIVKSPPITPPIKQDETEKKSWLDEFLFG